MPLMVSVPVSSNVQVRFSPQVPEAVSAADAVAGSMVTTISNASSKLQILFFIVSSFTFSIFAQFVFYHIYQL